MTTDEKLDLILSRLDVIESDVSSLKTDVSSLKTDVSSLKTNVSSLQSDVSTLQKAQAQTTATLEDVVNKCIRVLYEGYKLNAERVDKFDVDSIKRNSELAVTLAKISYRKAMKKAV